MWKRVLLTALAVVLGMSGTTVLAGMLNRAAPVPVDPIALGIEDPGMAAPLTPSLPPGPAIVVNPAPVTLGSDDPDLDDDDDGGGEDANADDDSGDDDLFDEEDDSGEADVGDGDD
jgi:hypothetical protein